MEMEWRVGVDTVCWCAQHLDVRKTFPIYQDCRNAVSAITCVSDATANGHYYTHKNDPSDYCSPLFGSNRIRHRNARKTRNRNKTSSNLMTPKRTSRTFAWWHGRVLHVCDFSLTNSMRRPLNAHQTEVMPEIVRVSHTTHPDTAHIIWFDDIWPRTTNIGKLRCVALFRSNKEFLIKDRLPQSYNHHHHSRLSVSFFRFCVFFWLRGSGCQRNEPIIFIFFAFTFSVCFVVGASGRHSFFVSSLSWIELSHICLCVCEL